MGQVSAKSREPRLLKISSAIIYSQWFTAHDLSTHVPMYAGDIGLQAGSE